MNMEYVTASPSLVFTACTVLIGIAFVLIAPSWNRIKKTLGGLTKVQRIRAFTMRNVRNAKRKDRAFALNSLLIGCFLLGISIAVNLAALVGIAGMMLGLHLGPFQAENYVWGVWCVFIGIGFFVTGTYFIGIIRIWEVIRFKWGEPDPLDG